jgi:hypothetical protein
MCLLTIGTIGAVKGKKRNQLVLFAQIGFSDRMDKFPTKKEMVYANILTTPKSQPDDFIPP